MASSKELKFYGLKSLPSNPKEGLYYITPNSGEVFDMYLVVGTRVIDLNAAKQSVLDQVENELDAKIALRALATDVYTKGVTYNKTEVDAITQSTLASITSGFRGVISPTDPAPILDGVYKPTVTQNEAGTDITYPGAGGLTVNTAEGGDDYGKSVEFIKNGGSWVKVNTPMPIQDISGLAEKSQLQYRGTFDNLALALSGVPLATRKLGDTVGIKENGSVVEYWWESSTADGGLILKQPASNVYPFIPNGANNPQFLKLVKDVLITSSAVDSTDKKTLWIENVTATTATVVLYNYTNANVQSVVARSTVDFTSVTERVKVFPLISASDGVTLLGYVAVDKTALPSLVGVAISRPQHELSKDIFNIKNGQYISFNQTYSKQAETSAEIPAIKTRLDTIESKVPILFSKTNVLVDGYKTEYQKINDSVKSIAIYNTANLTDFKFHRFLYDGGTIQVNIRANQGDNIVEFNYDSRVEGAVYPDDITNHSIILSNIEKTVTVLILVDWTKAGIVIRSPDVPTYAESGISHRHVINSREAEAIRQGLAISSNENQSVGQSTTMSPMVLSVVGGVGYEWMEQYLTESMPEGTYIISSVESEINTFLDSYLSATERYTVRFYGLINTALGLHKHPNMNFEGYGCTLRMGDALGQDYQMCIRPTNGGVVPATSRIIDHKYTHIKGFFLDGNQANNPTANTFYASGICSEIFHEFVEPYTGTQFTTNIVCEDIRTKNFIRNGIVTGKGWRFRNIDIEYSRTDHGLYIPGGGDVFGENITFRGFFEKGPLSIAGNNKSYQLFKSDNIRLNNVIIDECTGGVWVDIRGQFPNTLYPCNNVIIDGLTIRSTEKRGNLMFMLGSELPPEGSTFTSENFPKNIEIRNLNADVNINNDMFRLSRGQFKISGRIKANINRPDRGMFFIKGAGNHVLNSVDIGGLNIELTGVPTSGVFPLIQLDNTSTTNWPLNGFNMSGMTILGAANYSLFAIRDIANPNNYVVKNLNMKDVIATPLSVIRAGDESKITFVKENVVDPVIEFE